MASKRSAIKTERSESPTMIPIAADVHSPSRSPSTDTAAHQPTQHALRNTDPSPSYGHYGNRIIQYSVTLVSGYCRNRYTYSLNPGTLFTSYCVHNRSGIPKSFQQKILAQRPRGIYIAANACDTFNVPRRKKVSVSQKFDRSRFSVEME